ncbi:hypothetical protein H0H93_015532 [Arthromyces matolae]|nr:hypothetical protein H0H93_015532 [Arthromyces matolae]
MSERSPLRVSVGSERPVELVFGITPIGTSHLLLTEDQVRLMLMRPPYDFVSSSAFQSLSHIHFHTKEDFKEIWGRLKPKYVKNRPGWDNSQENKVFQTSEGDSNRGQFELGRLFYRIISEGQRFNCTKFSLHLRDLSWAESVQVYSFAFTRRSGDTRPNSVRINTPIALDCGHAKANVPHLQYQEGTAVHYSFSNNATFGAGPDKLAFDYGATEELDEMAISARLQDFFSKLDNKGPVILLVYEEEVTMNLLKKLRVNTSSWKYGLQDLLNVSNHQDHHGNYHRPRNDSHSEQYGRRTRSRSPSRSSSTMSTRSRRDDYSLPPRQNSLAPVYVVDIKKYYMILMATETASENIAAIAGRNGLNIADIKGWCAGNDAVVMLKIWHAMVSGLSIIQQREQRRKNQRSTVNASGSGDTATPDNDFDPTTVDLVRPPTMNYYDDESDNGESTDSDD